MSCVDLYRGPGVTLRCSPFPEENLGSSAKTYPPYHTFQLNSSQKVLEFRSFLIRRMPTANTPIHIHPGPLGHFDSIDTSRYSLQHFYVSAKGV